MSIFDFVQAPALAAYWTELAQDEPPYVGQELFPDDKKRGLTLSWIKGAKGLPVVLRNSAFDVHAIPRPRIGFEKMQTEMPYFKESTYIDEELRQELNIVLETGNSLYIDAVINHIFDDETQLLRGARATRERMRMMALTTGAISLASNGQQYDYDYGIPEEHKGDAAVKWSDTEKADPIEDMRLAKEKIMEDTGVEITRGMMNTVTWRNLRKNVAIIHEIFALAGGSITSVSDAALRTYVRDQLSIDIVINDKRYTDETGTTQKFFPDNTVVLMPSGPLGKTWFGTTPAESDLMGGSVANVAVTDTGVSITTTKHVDPVQVETIVAMICVPSFEAADHVYIMDTEPA